MKVKTDIGCSLIESICISRKVILKKGNIVYMLSFKPVILNEG